ncbi:DUF721 domain-containing protein [Bartonella sp. CB175]|uniref:DUF721 domain-containing protein n=1 Tax=Bartonella sp. CB175 TaxID=3112256 RepID=UPI00300E595B
MRKQFQQRHFDSLSETVFKMLDPVLRKRTGLNVALIEHWSQIAGCDIGHYTMPLKIIWKRRLDQDDVFQPATLVIACEGFMALKVLHETDELLHRINGFFGYIAIDRIKIVQRRISVLTDCSSVKLIPNEEDKKHVKKMLENITNEGLRQSLYEFGCHIFTEKRANKEKH